MNYFFKNTALFLFALVLIISCEAPSSTSEGNKLSEPTTEQPTSPPEELSNTSDRTVLSKKDCPVKGKILEGNRKLIADQNVMVTIVADSTTFDQKFGDSHRILEVYELENCNMVMRKILPINISPDYSYQIADIIYNNNSHIVAIKAHGGIYCYDIENQQLSEPLIPQYLNDRMEVDAQSGRVDHLEVWENYLVGYARDWGAFVFDLSDSANPKTLMPAAEYDLTGGDEEEFSSLFFLRSQNGATFQAVVPSYDYTERTFNVNALFENPKNISPVIPKNVSNNRFIILRNTVEPPTAMAVDMKKQHRIPLPKEIVSKKTSEILEWVKKNQK